MCDWKFKLAGVSIAAALMVAWPSAGGATARFIPMGDLPGGVFESQAFAVSDDGSTVVGTASATDFPTPVRWRESEGLVSLSLPRGWPALAYATGISGDGSLITGFAMTSLGLKSYYAALYWNADLEPISLAQFMTYGMMSETDNASADASMIVGNDMVGGDFDPAFSSSKAFVHHPGGSIDFLPHIFGSASFSDVSYAVSISADGSVVVGSEDNFTGSHAVRWVRTGGAYVPQFLGELAGPFANSMATDVTPDGLVIIGQAETPLGVEPFRWTAQTGTVSLGIPPGNGIFNGTASAVSADGSVILGSWAGGLYPWYAAAGAAFVWDAGRGVRDLKTVLESDYGLVLTGWQLTFPSDMTPDGRTIIGTGINPAGRMEGWIVHLPPAQPADLDGDGDVDGLDLAAVLASWGPCSTPRGCCPADFDCSGSVNGLDLAMLLGAWG